eukprot:1152809-Pelagomonas_calceolata.AAC.8
MQPGLAAAAAAAALAAAVWLRPAMQESACTHLRVKWWPCMSWFQHPCIQWNCICVLRTR